MMWGTPDSHGDELAESCRDGRTDALLEALMGRLGTGEPLTYPRELLLRSSDFLVIYKGCTCGKFKIDMQGNDR